MNKVIILGAGGSAGVPTALNFWGQCDPENPKNRRTRASIYIEINKLKILIDTSPDLRHQMLTQGIEDLNAVFFTHAHADHTHGIDELKSIFYKHNNQKIPIYGSSETLIDLKRRFDYMFHESEDSPYRALLEPYEIEGQFSVQGIEFTCFPQIHGNNVISTGFRIQNIAYCTDFYDLPPETIDQLQGLDVLIIDCLSLKTPPTHLNLNQSLQWISKLKPKRAILTHMGPTLDYETVRQMVPGHVEPGYDGLTILF